MPWEHPDGYFPAALAFCRRADLRQLGEQVGVPRGPSTGLGEAALGAQGVTGPSSQWRWLERRRTGGRHMVGSSLGKASGRRQWGTKGSCLPPGHALEEWR